MRESALIYSGHHEIARTPRERLQIHIEGDDEAIRATPCPPLMLQPLIENAVRHDLDCHDGQGDIRLVLRRIGAALSITVSNPIGQGASPNPGTGLGLANTRARLLPANPSATLAAERRGERFVAEMRLAMQAHGDWLLVAECDSADKARAALASFPIDVLFLDIQMPRESGLLLARELACSASPPLTVFVTAYSSYALEAFDVHALGYLLNPLDDERLTQTVEHARAMLAGRPPRIDPKPLTTFAHLHCSAGVPVSERYVQGVRILLGADQAGSALG